MLIGEAIRRRRQELIACNVRFEAALEKDRAPIYRQAMKTIAAMEQITDPEDTLTRQAIGVGSFWTARTVSGFFR